MAFALKRSAAPAAETTSFLATSRHISLGNPMHASLKTTIRKSMTPKSGTTVTNACRGEMTNPALLELLKGLTQLGEAPLQAAQDFGLC